MATITKHLKSNRELSYLAQERVKRRGKIVFSETSRFPKEGNHLGQRLANNPTRLRPAPSHQTTLSLPSRRKWQMHCPDCLARYMA